jgi:SAM-dependent methyltransferase
MFEPGTDLCLGFFATVWNGGHCPELPPGAHVLEIGCAEADWISAMKHARPDLHVTGIDWRKDPRAQADLRIVGDVLEQEFEPASFDAIIGVSVIEWVGAGHYADPVHVDGDRALLERCHTWLKPGGWLYLDTPYGPPREKPRNGAMRVYTDETWSALIAGLFRERGAWDFEGRTSEGVLHPDGPYRAFVLEPI